MTNEEILNKMYDEFRAEGYNVDMYSDGSLWVWKKSGYNVVAYDMDDHIEMNICEKGDPVDTDCWKNKQLVKTASGIRIYTKRHLS
ncbi:hypothetical protein [Bacillus altitudinis]|uniref:hypothetical protein n=1 Tax=Bacillus altitudinis TaxID=293387 RepID=UPI001C248C82|nr:hypothetical protein [Bacillus altitudinis]MBU8855268.1 hypothetical protein [Bacillus sp. FJAT-26377]MCY7454298.1 hypothetical protein [Bacillus altitudinis]